MRVPVNKKPSGFTLVEMAIVLVIIGIILAGVMKGRDIVRGSQIKQFSQQFAQKWATIAQTYYDKTGQQLNDGATNAGLAGAPNGMMDGAMQARINTANTGVVATLEGVGIMPCALVKSKLQVAGSAVVYGGVAPAVSCSTGAGAAAVGMNLVQTQVEGEFAGTTNVTVDLVALNFTPAGAPNALNRNAVVLVNVPTDVAIGLDTAIDGSPNGAAGACLNLSTTGRTPNTNQAYYAPTATAGAAIATALTDWPNANTAQVHDVAIILDF